MSEYNTTVFANGYIMQWRLRDSNYNRFKCILSKLHHNLIEEAIWGIDYDDCDGNQFATICRAIAVL